MKYNILTLSFLILIMSCTSIIADNNYIINNNTVYIDDSKVYLSATPHTLSSSGWVYFNLISKVYTGNIDVCWGFNMSISKTTKAELYKFHWINTTTNHQKVFYNPSFVIYTGDELDYGNSYNINYRYTVTEQIINDNGTIYITSNIAFDSFDTNGTNYTMYWHTRHNHHCMWEDFTPSFNSVIHDYNGFNKWYYIKNIPITFNKEYTVRAWIDVPVSTEKQYGKYYFAIKPSGETISQAINNGHFYNLDPWWDAIWSHRKEIILTGRNTTISFCNPTEDGYIYNNSGSYSRWNSDTSLIMRADVISDDYYRSYMEWNITSIPDDAVISSVKLKYQGELNQEDAHIKAMICKPSISTNLDVYLDINNGTTYIDSIGFPEVGNNKEVNLGSSAVADLQSALSLNWFAIGLVLDSESSSAQSAIRSEEGAPSPAPTLHVEYTSASKDNAQTDYQLLLNVTYDSDMQSDFDDLRFCNETHKLDSWLEFKVDGSYALIWVEFPTTPANGVEQIYYMYYRNAGAANYWDFDNTFIFGDPFNNITLDTGRWTSVDGNPTYSIDTANHYLEITDMDDSNWRNGKGFHSKTISLPTEWIIEDVYGSNGFGMYHDSSVSGDLFGNIFSVHHGTWSSTDYGIGFYSMEDAWTSTTSVMRNIGVGGNIDYGSGEQTPSLPITYFAKFWKTVGNIHITDDGVERVNEANIETPDRVHLGISKHSTYSYGTNRFYAFKVRKYAANPPTYAFSSEEYYIPPTSTTLINETKLIMSEITQGMKGINMGNYLVYTFILIGILLIILGIQIITNNIYRR